MTSVTACPITVAMAAPSMPIFGQKPMPKIITGSRMIFVMQPVIIAIIEIRICPTAWKSFS